MKNKKCKKRFPGRVMPLDASASADFDREMHADPSEAGKPLTGLLLPDETPAADPKLENYSFIYFAIESRILDCWDSDRSIKDADALGAYGELLKDLDECPENSLTAKISESIKTMLSRLKNEDDLRYTKGELRSCLSFLIGIARSHESPLGDGYLRWVRTFFRSGLPETKKECLDYIRDNESKFAKPLEALGWEEMPGSCASPRTAGAMDAQPKIRIGRNDPCLCGSGKKYKKCCLGRGPEEERMEAAEEK